MKGGTVDSEEGFMKLPDGGQMAYQICGLSNGRRPVLLIRPLGGSMELWGSFRARLAEEFCVISFDHRGTGRSSPDPRWVDTKGLADDCLRVLGHLGVSRAHVFGISLGGMTATWLPIVAPTRVATLCIASAPARGVELTPSVRCMLSLAGCFIRRSNEVEASLVDRVLSRRFREAHPDEVRRIEQPLRTSPAGRLALLKLAAAGVLHDARKDLHSIEVPTLVLAGQNDRVLGTDAPRALSVAIPRATFEIIAAAGHDLTLEQPTLTAERVRDFFVSSPSQP